MSATNRGTKREFLDRYETPSEAIERLLEVFPFTPDTLFYDPCAGSGNIIKTTRKFYPKANYIASEIDPSLAIDLKKLRIPFLIQDFLKVTNKDLTALTKSKNKKIDVILTNPPFSLGYEFVKKSLEISENVIMLLRLNFLASKKRQQFMQSNTPSVYVLPNRPSFVNGKTDATDYGWFHWSNTQKIGGLHILNLN